jgi:1-acyl-sn-glycerol-3-phosphate acyltransferase
MTRLFMRLSGIPFLVRGRDNIPPGPVVLAPNHTSYLDALVLIAILGPRQFSFIAKREFVDNWVMRTLLEGFGTVFVERFDVQKSAEHADELAEAAKRGQSLAIFPEGTLLRRAGLLPFRMGAFQVAAEAGIPVVPMALRGVRSVLRDGTWFPRRYPIAVTIGAPVAPDGDDWNAAVRLRDRVRAEVLKYCGEPDLSS